MAVGTSDGPGGDAGRPWRVLVVEDEYYIADEIRQALEVQGVEVVGPVPTVERALTFVADEAPIAIAVLDVKLGDEMVWPVVDALERRGVEYVFATGYGVADILPAYRMAPLFRKPLETAALIESLLDRRNSTWPNLR